jgi:hypothetical protein
VDSSLALLAAAPAKVELQLPSRAPLGQMKRLELPVSVSSPSLSTFSVLATPTQVLARSKHTALPLPLPPLPRLPIIPRRARAGVRGSEISRLAPEIRADPPAAAFSSGEAVGRAAAARSVSFRRRIGGTLPASGAFRFLCWPPRSLGEQSNGSD